MKTMYPFIRMMFNQDGGAATGGGGTEAPATNNAGTPDWTSSLSPDDKGYIENKGFKDVGMILGSYRGLEKMLGKKEQVMLRPEKEDDAQGWNDFYNKMGRPEKPDGYELGLPNEADTDKAFAKWAQENFHKVGLTKTQAANLAKEYMGFSKSLIDSQNQQTEQIIAQAESSLKKEWGAAFDQNKNIAERTLVKLGIDSAQLEKLEGALGPVAVAKMFHGIGSKIGEDTFVSSEGNQTGMLTPAAAISKINELRNDRNFVERFAKGDSDALKEMNRLHQMAFPSA